MQELLESAPLITKAGDLLLLTIPKRPMVQHRVQGLTMRDVQNSPESTV
jgi:hypothetical protein